MFEKILYLALTLKAKASRERGQDLIEYAMLGGLIAVILMAAAALLTITGALEGMITGIGNCIDFNGGTLCDPF